MAPAELGCHSSSPGLGHKGKQQEQPGAPLLEGKVLALGAQHWGCVCKQAQS